MSVSVATVKEFVNFVNVSTVGAVYRDTILDARENKSITYEIDFILREKF